MYMESVDDWAIIRILQSNNISVVKMILKTEKAHKNKKRASYTIRTTFLY